VTDATTYGRETIQIVEIEQPRCVNRFGSSPCTASGTPKCYQTYWTCLDRDNYNPAGFIRWRFSRPADNTGWLYETFDNDDEIGTNAFATLGSVSENSSKLNLGSTRKGESPFGLLASVSITLSDFAFDDSVGDFYTPDRGTISNSSFWAKWAARNPFYPNMRIRVYEGYKGQALADMQVRLYLLETVDGPDGRGNVTIKGVDPLRLTNKALFPRPTNIKIGNLAGISSFQTTIDVVCLEADLSDNFGNTGSLRYVRYGSEIISYTGWTGTSPEFALTGVVRGTLGTTASSQNLDEGGQRVGRYQNVRQWEVAADLMDNHTPIPAGFRDTAQWTVEGEKYLNTLRSRTTVAEPVEVEELLGELSRDGLFNFWWDERTQKIPLLAVRPPNETPLAITDDLNIIMDTYGKKREPDDRMSRVTVFYDQRDPTQGLEDFVNYRNRTIRIEGEYELDDATGGEVRDNTIYSRWISSDTNALLLGASLLLRFKEVPEYLSMSFDAKDRAISIGYVLDVTTRNIVDTEGNAITTRWQVIAVSEPVSGHRISVQLQSYQFRGIFCIIMANDAPDYVDATDAEKLDGCWLADEATDLMPDGANPYLLQ